MNELKEEKELDDIMEDLIVGHNFDYARQAILDWHNKYIVKKQSEAQLSELKPIDKDMYMGEYPIETYIEDRINQLSSQLTNNKDGIENV